MKMIPTNTVQDNDNIDIFLSNTTAHPTSTYFTLKGVKQNGTFFISIPQSMPLGTMYLGVLGYVSTRFTIQVISSTSTILLKYAQLTGAVLVSKGYDRFHVYYRSIANTDAVTISASAYTGKIVMYASSTNAHPSADRYSWKTDSNTLSVATHDALLLEQVYVTIHCESDALYYIEPLEWNASVALTNGKPVSFTQPKETIQSFFYDHSGGPLKISADPFHSDTDSLQMYASTGTAYPTFLDKMWTGSGITYQTLVLDDASKGRYFISVIPTSSFANSITYSVVAFSATANDSSASPHVTQQ